MEVWFPSDARFENKNRYLSTSMCGLRLLMSVIWAVCYLASSSIKLLNFVLKPAPLIYSWISSNYTITERWARVFKAWGKRLTEKDVTDTCKLNSMPHACQKSGVLWRSLWFLISRIEFDCMLNVEVWKFHIFFIPHYN